jgi:glycerophosphoryl diester phosphodiesterase
VTPHAYLRGPLPLVIGHRGCAGEAPENTLASFERALAQGADILESDLHLTRDGVPVLLHDDDLARTTDAAGNIRDFDASELARVDAGWRFSADGGRSFPYRERGIRIPALRTALQRFPHARFNLELKLADPALAVAALDVIEAAGAADRVLLTAGENDAMDVLREELSRRATPVAEGACVADILELVAATREHRAPRGRAHAYQMPPEFAGATLVTRELIATAHAAGAQIHVWTLNELDELTRMLDLGVDGIVTDHPGRLFDLLVERGARRRGAA